MYLTACGLVTPVGLSFPSATAAMRGGITAFAEVPYHDSLGKPVIGAEIPGVADGLARGRTPVPTAGDGGHGVSGTSGPRTSGKHAHRHQSCRAGGSGQACIVDPVNSVAACRETRLPVSRAIGVLREGRVGAAQALAIARQLFAEGFRRCLIAGVDSLISAEALRALADAERLKTEANPDGLIPGEAACALMIDAAPHTHEHPAVQVAGIGFGQERGPARERRPRSGLGLAAALKGHFMRPASTSPTQRAASRM